MKKLRELVWLRLGATAATACGPIYGLFAAESPVLKLLLSVSLLLLSKAIADSLCDAAYFHAAVVPHRKLVALESSVYDAQVEQLYWKGVRDGVDYTLTVSSDPGERETPNLTQGRRERSPTD
jgi:hypothetical protein